MVNDAQVQSPPNLVVRDEDERTNAACNVNSPVTKLEYKVIKPSLVSVHRSIFEIDSIFVSF